MELEPGPDVFPTGQFVGTCDPRSQNVSAGHCVGADAPPGQNDPFGHSTDDVAAGQ